MGAWEKMEKRKPVAMVFHVVGVWENEKKGNAKKCKNPHLRFSPVALPIWDDTVMVFDVIVGGGGLTAQIRTLRGRDAPSHSQGGKGGGG